MKEKPELKREKIGELLDASIADVASATDQEILEDIKDLYGGADNIEREFSAIFEKAQMIARKEKLLSAKSELAQGKGTQNSVVQFDRVSARQQYNSLVANDPETVKKMTLAARNGRGQSERDIDSALEDLAELGALSSEKKE